MDQKLLIKLVLGLTLVAQNITLVQAAELAEPKPDTKVIAPATDQKSIPNNAAADTQAEAEADDDGDGVSWNATINRALLSVKDGYSRHSYFVDNNCDNSNIGLIGINKLNNDLKIGGEFMLYLRPGNSSDDPDKVVSQLNRSGTTDNIRVNIADAWLQTAAGKLSLGRGRVATDGSSFCNFSGTDMVMYAGAADIAGGMYFHGVDNPGQVNSSDPQISGNSGIFEPISGLTPRRDRLRYDFAEYKGFILSASIANDVTPVNDTVAKNKYLTDLGLTYKRTGKCFEYSGAIGFARKSLDSSLKRAQCYNGSFAMLHRASDFNFAIAGGNAKPEINSILDPLQRMRQFRYLQLGKKFDLCCYGKTNFAVDYWNAKNSLNDYDKARAYGVALVQNLTKLNTDLYLGARRYKYITLTQQYHPIVAVMAGIRIQFKGKLEQDEPCN